MRKICLLLALVVTLGSGFLALPVDVSATATSGKAAAVVPVSGKININTADEAVLASLPGIGPKTAAAIADYRKQHGSFQALDDLQQVKGIGEKKLAKMKPYLEKI